MRSREREVSTVMREGRGEKGEKEVKVEAKEEGLQAKGSKEEGEEEEEEEAWSGEGMEVEEK